MIDEETVDLLVERLIRRIELMNTYFLTEMGSSIKKIKKLTPSEAQKLVQILKYGGNYEEMIQELSKYTELNVKELDKIFSTYAKKDTIFYKDFYEYRNKPFIPFDENIILQNQTKALSNLAKQEMYNFTRTNILGYTIRDINGIPRFLGLQETYNRVLDDALLSVSEGKETFNSSMFRIMKEIGGSGLKTIEYESGRTMRLDSAIRMHLKGRLRELHNENQKIIGDEIGADGVEITVHENPAPDHTEAQGKQFSNAEYEKLQNGDIARTYDGEIITLDHDGKNGYRPISEMNCYHRFYSIVLGVSKPTYSKKELNDIKKRNKKGFEFDGKRYTMYKGTQLQRMLERKIREQKDIQTFAISGDNYLLAGKTQNKIRVLSDKYNQLCQKSGLPRKNDRLNVANYKRNKQATDTYKKEINKYKIGEFDATKYGNNFNSNTKDVILTDERKEHIYAYHKNANEYMDRMEDVLNNYDSAYKELDKQGTIWLTKKYKDQRLNLVLKINETTLYQKKQLGYKNSVITFYPIRKNYIKNSTKKGKIKRLVAQKEKK